MRELVKERFGGGFNCSNEVSARCHPITQNRTHLSLTTAQDLENLMTSDRTKDYLNGILESANGNEELTTAIVRALRKHMPSLCL